MLDVADASCRLMVSVHQVILDCKHSVASVFTRLSHPGRVDAGGVGVV